MTHILLTLTRTSQDTAVNPYYLSDTDSDIEYIYPGRTSVDRLIHIIATCPSIAPQAFQLAVKQIEDLRDPSLYTSALSTYEQLPTITDAPLPAATDVAHLDPKWIEETTKRNSVEKTKLEVELKNYANNMIKESQRVCQALLFKGLVVVSGPYFDGLDGTPGAWGVLSLGGRLFDSFKTLHQVEGILYDQSACARYVPIRP
jgi:hypothetical protein